VAKDLVGERFGRLVVVEKAHKQRGKQYWKCKCDCGNTTISIGWQLEGGLAKSCGCLRRENGADRYKVSICFDCKNACGGCSWSGIDPVTKKCLFEPVPGWTAEPVYLKMSKRRVKTYHITACPLFEKG
jgi:hypothetical protein